MSSEQQPATTAFGTADTDGAPLFVPFSATLVERFDRGAAAATSTSSLQVARFARAPLFLIDAALLI